MNLIILGIELNIRIALTSYGTKSKYERLASSPLLCAWSVFTLECISAKIDKVSQYSDNSTTTGAKKRNTSYLNGWTWPNHTINKSITRPRLASKNFFSSYFQNIYVIQIKLWVLLLSVRKRDQLWWNQSTRSAGSFKTSIIFTFF